MSTAKTGKNYKPTQEPNETSTGNRIKRNGKNYQSAGTRFPSFLNVQDFDGKREFQLIDESYHSEKLTDEQGNEKEFYQFADTETGELFICEKFGHLKYQINLIPEQFRKMPLYLLIRWKGKTAMKNNPKTSVHTFEVDWANDEA
jgi:hypothetical protein